MMVRRAVQDGVGAIKLLREQSTHELVRKGHCGERQDQIGPLAHGIVHSISTSYDEGHLFHPLVTPLAQSIGEGGARQLRTSLIEHHNTLPGLERRQEAFAFDLLLVGWGACTCLRHHYLLEGGQTLDALYIRRHAFAH